jgi:nucleotide-binding universal stress UspA family protein
MIVMWPIKTVLLPTDFSDASQAALRLASSFARDQSARLVILHVTVVPDTAYEGYGTPGAPLLREEYLAKEKQDLEKWSPQTRRSNSSVVWKRAILPPRFFASRRKSMPT